MNEIWGAYFRVGGLLSEFYGILFEKAFDSVHRNSLWTITKSYGIPYKIIDVVKAMYENFECAVVDEGELTDWVRVRTSGVKQGCVMSGFFFLLVDDWPGDETNVRGEKNRNPMQFHRRTRRSRLRR